MEVSIQEAEPTLTRLLDSALHGDDVVITREGRPVARLVPVATIEADEGIISADDKVIAALTPAARRIWARRGRLKLDGETIKALISEGRR